MLKKSLLLLLALMLVFSLSGCGSNEPADVEEPKISEEPGTAQSYDSLEDGIYFAQDDEFAGSGWKYVVTIEVENGEIVSAEWNGVHKDAGPDKLTLSKSGEYGLVEIGGAQAEWHEQAELAVAYLLETQDPTKITYTDEAGHTDAIAGVSIHVIEFFELAKKALDNGPVGRGEYKDGYYHAEADDYQNDFKYFVDLTVINGYIVAAKWNALNPDGEDKFTLSESGEYGMVEIGGAQAEWHEQAEAVAAHLIKTQDPTAINYVDDAGHTDDIAGVSINVNVFFELAEKALADAK